MRYFFILLSSILLLFSFRVAAQTEGDWRDKMLLLVYAPRYFGPNAFPLPELRSGKAPVRYEVEMRGEYHAYSGDKTQDLFLRALLPIVKGRAGIEIRFVALEKYKLTPETRDERNAAETECPPNEKYNGDLTISAFYQLLRSEKWADALFGLHLKTATGGRLCDARFTDAATYWVDLTAGKDLLKSKNQRYALRLQALAGFYCWMTNDMIHRQNDAFLYGAGLTGIFRPFEFSSSLAGFSGYKNNGDHPLLWRNNLQFEYRNHILSFHYVHGMKDSLYETYSAGYIFRF
ncbi:MAG: hypothetical protein LBB84_12705 [Tannerellaceae bacterium]|jgi:hypothetical protein|nr:hypothetical protein [Tannerellaceae bacterium]